MIAYITGALENILKMFLLVEFHLLCQKVVDNVQICVFL